LTKKIEVEILELKETDNGMTESLSVFADEVMRVAREVGTEGRLGGQARVTNVGGTWKDLTDNVNVMAANVSTVLYRDGKWTDRCHLLVDAASAYDHCCYCTFTPTILVPFYSCYFTDGCCPGRSHTEDHWRLRFWRDAQPQISAAAMDGDFTRVITVEASGEMDSLKTQINQMVFNMSHEIR
jgi:osomolarity two-component system sensor histidine kinase NIK1